MYHCVKYKIFSENKVEKPGGNFRNWNLYNIFSSLVGTLYDSKSMYLNKLNAVHYCVICVYIL